MLHVTQVEKFWILLETGWDGCTDGGSDCFRYLVQDLTKVITQFESEIILELDLL